MSELVIILATVRPGESRGLDLAGLVFKTIRVGFPTAEVVCQGNGLQAPAAAFMEEAARAVPTARFENVLPTMHDRWLENLVALGDRPFWIVDPDVVFFDVMEDRYRENDWTPLAGRYEPEFVEPWSRAVHVARLHTCVMYINPALLRAEVRRWQGKFPAFFASWVGMGLCRARFVPVRSGPEGLVRFYDTAAGWYQAGIGDAFTPEVDRCFEHLHCGSYGDQIAQELGWKELTEMHAAVLADPRVARGLRRKQTEWYDQRRGGEKEIYAIQSGS